MCVLISDEQRAKYLKDMEDVLTGLVSCEHKVAVTRQAVKEATNRALDEGTEQIGVSLFDDVRVIIFTRECKNRRIRKLENVRIRELGCLRRKNGRLVLCRPNEGFEVV